MPMGLTNSPATFQRVMELVLRGLPWQVCTVYLDDVLIFSPTFEEHMFNLREVFSHIQAAGLKLNPQKCHLARDHVVFLGHVVSSRGPQPDPRNTNKVKSWPTPRSPTEHKEARRHTNADALSRRPEGVLGPAPLVNVISSSPAPHSAPIDAQVRVHSPPVPSPPVPSPPVPSAPVPSPSVAPPVGGELWHSLMGDSDYIARLQREDPDIGTVLDWIRAGGSRPPRGQLRGSRWLRKLWPEFPRLSLVGELLCRTVYPSPAGEPQHQVVVPASLVPELLSQLHCGPVSAHFSAERVWMQARTVCYWPSMLKDIRQWCEQCVPFQTRKAPVPKHRAPMGGLQTVRPFQRVAMNILELPKRLRSGSAAQTEELKTDW
uniref:Gypsy retrotransposon integrase-like protein 1 n=1 Tax=Knipowitschia caucasica TaxID=637954 RepID=A0AAV2JUT5_KNICA